MIVTREEPRVYELIDCLRWGGTEMQFVELLRGLPDEGFRAVAGTLARSGPYLPEIRRLGIALEEYPLRGTLVRPNTGVQIARLAAQIRRSGAQVVHAHDLYTSAIAVPAARLARRRVVVSRLDLGHWMSQTTRRIAAALTRRADRVIVNAHAIKAMLVAEDHVDPDRIAVVANGIDWQRYDAAARAEPDPTVPELATHPCVIMVANMMHPVKGHRDVLFAAQILAEHCPGARILLVGGGTLRPELERLAEALGVTRTVRFVGHRFDVAALAARATVGLSASYAEGISNAILELMAGGLPVVATAVGGSVELIEDGRDGFLVPPGSPTLLAERLVALLTVPGRARAMGQLARERVRERFDRRRMVAGFCRVYREAMAVADQPPHVAAA